MKQMIRYIRYIIVFGALIGCADGWSQNLSTSSGVSKNVAKQAPGRRSSRTAVSKVPSTGSDTQALADDSEREWMKVIYRRLDLTAAPNAPLYYPEEPAEDETSLFRIIMDGVASGELPAYEYLDGRESFTDAHRVNVSDMLERFHIPATEGKGSSERLRRFEIDPADVPAHEVLSYYVVERWEFDRRHSRTRSAVTAICPVLHRSDDYGGEPMRYPMFWVKYEDLKPYLTSQLIFIDDHDNTPSYTYDDYFRMNLYDGEIYKTRNVRNMSMAQIYPEADDRKRAQDSIENRLTGFEKGLWVPSLDELRAADGDSVGVSDRAVSRSRKPSARSASSEARPAKVKRTRQASSGRSAATRSVRNRRK